jgi:hypothetical protein
VTIDATVTGWQPRRPAFAVTKAENAYDYAGQDPINGYDLTGLMWDPESGDIGIPFENLDPDTTTQDVETRNGKPVQRIYEPSPKHGAEARKGPGGQVISRAPRGNGQEILDRSRPKGPNTSARIGVEPETGLEVVLRRTLVQELEEIIREIYHGFVPHG